ncbi:MAG: D-alanine--D-alanine ligase [Puniceicoccaceae bacterium]|nr:MAG: D-alanine--D-alanine ligase [Puniceicoccaceae bacterium]
MKAPVVAVFAGGISAEREVSLGSGRAAYEALRQLGEAAWFEITEAALPDGLDPDRHVVFSTLHGRFGEDGGMQRLLDAAGVEYAGCDAAASELCFNKSRTKAAAAAAGIPVVEGLAIDAVDAPATDEILDRLGPSLVAKPEAEGSSVGLAMLEGPEALRAWLAENSSGRWLLERRLRGRELTVGVLEGRAMGVVEVRPLSGVFDYEHKYTKGKTEFLAPAPLRDETAARLRGHAETVWSACGCRDFARIDFFLTGEEAEAYLLEVNTLPGLKETSLLPMSASCCGHDFASLVRAMIGPALERHRHRHRHPE